MQELDYGTERVRGALMQGQREAALDQARNTLKAHSELAIDPVGKIATL